MEPTTAQRAVVVRSGGLGDFILSLPLIRALAGQGRAVTLVTRSSYWRLAGDGDVAEGFLDVDGACFGSLFGRPSGELRDLLAGATVFSYFPDQDGDMAHRLHAAGAAKVVALPSRPRLPPHAVAQAFQAAGLTWDDALLGRPHWPRAKMPGRPVLWLHPGSGGAAKNAPFETFLAAARAAAEEGREVWWSAGEADQELLPAIDRASRNLPGRFVQEPDLVKLRRLLTAHAGRVICSDTGIGHLAAALAIPVSVYFRSTNPVVWRPLGPEVTVQCV